LTLLFVVFFSYLVQYATMMTNSVDLRIAVNRAVAQCVVIEHLPIWRKPCPTWTVTTLAIKLARVFCNQNINLFISLRLPKWSALRVLSSRVKMCIWTTKFRISRLS
jgi:hypothetical protein